MPWNSLTTKLSVTPVQLSEDDVKRARTYLPMLHKRALIEQLAGSCIQRVNLTVNDIQPIPPRVQEDGFAKSLILTAVLCGFYLDIYDASSLLRKENPTFEFSMADYDNYSAVSSQLERMRKHPDEDVRTNAQAILNDYRDFEKRLNLAIYNRMSAQNDTCARIVEMMNMQATPEVVKSALEQFKDMQAELSAMTEKVQKDTAAVANPSSEALKETTGGEGASSEASPAPPDEARTEQAPDSEAQKAG